MAYKNSNTVKYKEEDQIIDFGTHKGEKIIDVINKEPKYIKWCLENVKGFKLNKKLLEVYNNSIKEN